MFLILEVWLLLLINLRNKTLGFVFFALSIIVYRIVIDASYEITFERFSYSGMFKYDENSFSKLLSWLLNLMIIPIIYLYYSSKTISGKILFILMLISAIPTFSLIGFRSDYKDTYIVLIITYWIFMFLYWSLLPRVLITKGIRAEALFSIITAVLCTTVIYVWVVYAKMHLQLDLFETVYATREKARAFQVNTIIAYIWLFSDNFLPVSAIYFLMRKKYLISLSIMAVVYFNFSITATKQVIFLLMLGVAGYFLTAFVSKSQYIFSGILFVLFLSLVEPIMFGTYFLNNFFPYRVFFIPAELHYAHFNFFQSNPIDYFAQGPLKFFISSSYDTPIAFLIGQQTIGDITARANNGLFSDAYQNLGSVGVAFLPLLIVFYLKTLDGVTQHKDQRLLFIVILYVSFVLLGIPLSTALLSSGFVGLILLFAVLPNSKHAE